MVASPRDERRPRLHRVQSCGPPEVLCPRFDYQTPWSLARQIEKLANIYRRVNERRAWSHVLVRLEFAFGMENPLEIPGAVKKPLRASLRMGARDLSNLRNGVSSPRKKRERESSYLK